MAEKKEKELGKVVHWYDKVGVAVVNLSGPLAVGDAIKVSRGDEETEDTVVSMQLDHADISSGVKGQEVAIKISGRAKEGSVICKV